MHPYQPHEHREHQAQHSHEHKANNVQYHEHANHQHPSQKITEIKTLLEWDAPSRMYRKRNKEYYVNILLLVLACETILFLFSQYVFMLVVLSLGFLMYSFAVTPPDTVRCRLSTEGVAVGEHFYLWQELYDFYFKKRNGFETVHLRTKAFLPGELILLLGEVTKEQMKNTLLPYLPYREVVRQSMSEKAGDWISRTFPLDRHAA